MLKYQYVHPDPFSEALRYDYAPCQSRQFITAWETFRNDAKKQFEEKIYEGVAIEKPENTAEHTNTKQALSVLLQKKDNSQIIWGFIKKYEVFGRLYSHYTSEMRRHPDAQAATIDEYIIFAKALIKKAETEEPLQYLSTFLKLMDSFCGLQYVTPSQAVQLINLIEAEQNLIHRLEEG